MTEETYNIEKNVELSATRRHRKSSVQELLQVVDEQMVYGDSVVVSVRALGRLRVYIHSQSRYQSFSWGIVSRTAERGVSIRIWKVPLGADGKPDKNYLKNNKPPTGDQDGKTQPPHAG